MGSCKLVTVGFGLRIATQAERIQEADQK